VVPFVNCFADYDAFDVGDIAQDANVGRLWTPPLAMTGISTASAISR
jgi:hypothetical protein